MKSSKQSNLNPGLVTINTDASYFSDTKSGGWAAWIRFEGQLVTASGELKGKISDSTDAEKRAIANALTITARKGWEVKRVIVNTDSMGAIVAFRRPRKDDKIINAIRKEVPFLNRLSMRHVKAHTRAKNKRSWVNEWCDENARLHARKLHKKRQKNLLS